jgi:hypothetical protein
VLVVVSLLEGSGRPVHTGRINDSTRSFRAWESTTQGCYVRHGSRRPCSSSAVVTAPWLLPHDAVQVRCLFHLPRPQRLAPLRQGHGDRGQAHTAKLTCRVWVLVCARQAVARPLPPPETHSPADEDKLALAKAYFDVREYRRPAHLLTGCQSHRAVFLRGYACGPCLHACLPLPQSSRHAPMCVRLSVCARMCACVNVLALACVHHRRIFLFITTRN